MDEKENYDCTLEEVEEKFPMEKCNKCDNCHYDDGVSYCAKFIVNENT